MPDTRVVSFRESLLGRFVTRHPPSPAALLATLALAVGGWLFLMHVWPTRYRYDHLRACGGTYPVRFDRFTGVGEVFDGAWRVGDPC